MTTPTSRAEQRKARKQLNSASTTPRSSLEIPLDVQDIIAITRTPSPIPPPRMTTPTRLFVASIGNPTPYLSTLHSAGHTLNHRLALTLNHPPFSKSRPYANGLLSTSSASPYVLWQSPSFMNLSGVDLASAYKQFIRENAGGKLVVLHDELEAAMGEVKVRSGSASHKGHNGLKSIKERLGHVDHMRIGVGIGRPASRDAVDVSNYVLRKMSPVEKAKIEGAVGRVVLELQRLAG